MEFMIDFFNIEAQVNKRVQRFLLHKATEENIEPQNAKLLILTDTKKVFVFLMSKNTVVKLLDIQSITDFFGKQHNENHEQSVMAYIIKLAKEGQIEPNKARLIICETNNQLTAHLYDDTRYKRPIPTSEILKHFYSGK